MAALCRSELQLQAPWAGGVDCGMADEKRKRRRRWSIRDQPICRSAAVTIICTRFTCSYRRTPARALTHHMHARARRADPRKPNERRPRRSPVTTGRDAWRSAAQRRAIDGRRSCVWLPAPAARPTLWKKVLRQKVHNCGLTNLGPQLWTTLHKVVMGKRSYHHM